MSGVEKAMMALPDPGPAGLVSGNVAPVIAKPPVAGLEEMVAETVKALPDLGTAGPPSGDGTVVVAKSPASGIDEPIRAPSAPGPARSPSGFGAVLSVTSIFLPAAAALFTLVFVLFSDDTLSARLPLWGTLAALLLWLVSSALCHNLADAKHAIPSSYGEFQPRLAELEIVIADLHPRAATTTDGGEKVAYDEAVKEASEIRRDLDTKGFTWLLASGYSALWGRLYHAEEAMIEVAPKNKALEGAYRDEARLTGSEIANRDELLDKVRKARASFEPRGQAGDKASGAATADVEAEYAARAVLRHVRKSLNEYRNARWNGLILARNRLLATFALTGTIIFALLSIAIMFDAGKPPIIAATVFYLVGATVGLGNRLRSESQAESAVADYGLSAARLITIPLFSGLGALGGLLLVPYLQLTAARLGTEPPTAETRQASGVTEKAVPDKEAAKPAAPATRSEESTAKVPSPAASATEGAISDKAKQSEEATPKEQSKLRPLREIFDLTKNPFGFLVAAIFGLAPGLLFERLQQQADKYKADLKSTRST